MNSKELLIYIKTLFDGKGTSDAKTDIASTAKATEDLQAKADALASASEKSGKSLAESGKKSESGTKAAASGVSQLGQSTGRAAELVGSLTGAMGANSPAAAQMGASIRVLKSVVEGSSGGLMGLATILVGVGVSAYTAYQRKVEESKKVAQEFLASLTDAKIETGKRRISEIADSYNRVASAIDAARSAQSELAAAWQDLNKAGQEAADLELQRREKEELARLLPSDEAGATSVKNRYSAIRAQRDQSRREGDAVRAEQSARDDLAAAAAKRANNELKLGETQDQRERAAAQLDKARSRASFSNPDDQERKKAAEEVSAFIEQLSVLDKSVSALTEALDASKKSERAAEIRLQAAVTRSTRVVSADASLTDQTVSDLSRDTQRANLEQAISALKSRATAAASKTSAGANAYRAEADAYGPDSDNYDRQRDSRLESQAKSAARLNAKASSVLELLEKTPIERMASVLETVSSRLTEIERAVSSAEQRSRRQ